MNFTASRLSYKSTGYFSSIVDAYLSGASNLRSFYSHLPNLQGLKDAISARNQFPQDRSLLVKALKEQYAAMPASAAVQKNIELLGSQKTYTITTAHQPAIFTGTLYFVYKILHTVKLAAALKLELPDCDFVPVFYMGSEDADLDELGKIFLHGEKIEWDTRQTGAVGRMETKGLEKIITRIEGEVSVLPFGKELVQLLSDCYVGAENIQTATFKLIDKLFNELGLVVVIPDNALLKTAMQPVFEDDLLHQTASSIVEQTIEQLSGHFKVQAQPRAINLFYLLENKRERIEVKGQGYEVLNTEIHFTKETLLSELKDHPERFSPNVILRGLFQETILPNIAFIGGGGELAYWLELQDLFKHYKVPYPVLVLRNSFLIVEQKWKDKISKLGLKPNDFFRSPQDLLTSIVEKNANGALKITESLDALQQWYAGIKKKAGAIDKTLEQHVTALHTKANKPLLELEKKMLRAEKRKYQDQSRQIESIHAELFPLNNLQERIENFIPFYSQYGPDFITALYKHSLCLEQEFVILEAEKN